MPATEYGPDFFAEFLDLKRRIEVLERTERVGLSRIAFSQQTGSAEFSTLNAWSRTGGGVTLPSVTLVTGYKVIVTCGALPTDFGMNTTLRAYGGIFGFGIDGGDPDFVGLSVIAKRVFGYDAVGIFTSPMSFTVQITDMVPGEHEFALWGYAISSGIGGATVNLKFDDTTIQVIPIDLG